MLFFDQPNTLLALEAWDSTGGGGTPAKPKALLFEDDSLGAYYYLADGTWVKPSPSFTGTPHPQQFAGKIAALIQGGVKVINNSYPGFNIYDATTDGPAPSNGAINVMADLRAAIQANPDRDIDIVAGLLENGFDLYTLAQMKARWDSYNASRFAAGVKRIFHRVPVTRAGNYSNTVDGDITSNILAIRAYMRQQAAASGGTIFVAADADGPNITATDYPQNPQYCNQNDGGLYVHFTEPGNTEQANELRLLLQANGYSFSGPATSVGTGGVTTPTPGYLSSPQALDYYEDQPNAGYVNGRYTKTGGGSGVWNAHGNAKKKVDLSALKTGQECVIELEPPTPGGSGRLIGGDVAPITDNFRKMSGIYVDASITGFWDGTNVYGAISRSAANATDRPRLEYIRHDAASATGDQLIAYLGNAVLYTGKPGKFSDTLYLGCQLNSDATSSEGASIIPNGTITCDYILPA